MEVKFFVCRHCGNVIVKIVDHRVPPFCCGQKMEELTANTEEASTEKHIPVVEHLGDNRYKISVGSVEHPMTPEHHIAFVFVETEDGGQWVNLGDKPEAIVCTTSQPKAVYAYCNLHGLWKAQL
ncbi:MAG: desulfoferrodoxin [Bacteroidales bacterium]|nr:desulfoferrodoxin [Bacteroidales bacterium]